MIHSINPIRSGQTARNQRLLDRSLPPLLNTASSSSTHLPVNLYKAQRQTLENRLTHLNKKRQIIEGECKKYSKNKLEWAPCWHLLIAAIQYNFSPNEVHDAIIKCFEPSSLASMMRLINDYMTLNKKIEQTSQRIQALWNT